ncbi:MAG: response regulator [Proteobacteria bacterium]|nr:response regulator [Pseudomonadota bacterium]
MSSKEHCVLLVDDEPEVVKGLQRALRKEPYRILGAHSGPEALRVLRESPVDVIVSDENMPGMSGSELLGLVCREFPAVVRIILTGQTDQETAIRAINDGGVYRFLKKPIEPGEIAITLRNALQSRDLVLASSRLLRSAREQFALLEHLEETHPGITDVRRDVAGCIELEDPGDAASVIDEIENELRRIDPDAS